MKFLLLSLLVLAGCSRATVLKVEEGFSGLYCKQSENLGNGTHYDFEIKIPEKELLKKTIIEEEAKKYKIWLEIQSTPENTENSMPGRNTVMWKYQYKFVISEISSNKIIKSEQGSGQSKQVDVWHDAIGEKRYVLLDGDELVVHCYRY